MLDKMFLRCNYCIIYDFKSFVKILNILGADCLSRVFNLISRMSESLPELTITRNPKYVIIAKTYVKFSKEM